MLGMTGRVGTGPTFHHVVLVDPKATISRPANKVLDTNMVFKADQFRAWHEQHVEPDRFASGRQLAAWLGLVPQQSSSGGKPLLLGMSHFKPGASMYGP